VAVDWADVPALPLEPGRIPPKVEVKGLSVSDQGRPSLTGPGRIDQVTLDEFRAKRRTEELVFDLAGTLTRGYKVQPHCSVPAQALFPQLVEIVRKYLRDKVRVRPPAHLKDLFLAPYYGWVVERLVENIHGDISQGESPELPRYEATRGPGSTKDVDFWTSREVREVKRSHLNYVVVDTKRWEQSAAYFIDTHRAVKCFVKNAGLGLAIPYLYNGQIHDYMPDFLIRIDAKQERHLLLETKGYDPLKDLKKAAAERWVKAVNADGKFGCWRFAMVEDPNDIPRRLNDAAR
jgi:type III restriction enzyme